MSNSKQDLIEESARILGYSGYGTKKESVEVVRGADKVSLQSAAGRKAVDSDGLSLGNDAISLGGTSIAFSSDGGIVVAVTSGSKTTALEFDRDSAKELAKFIRSNT